MSLLPDFRNDMNTQMQALSTHELAGRLTPKELRVEAATQALITASVKGHNQVEIERRAGLIFGSKHYKSLVKKVNER